ncbi:MAG TPA: vWA domain-containing protein, partial [Polyangiaceae bacterium]|nr:vWA domain-containing protein [Polyangiaceae bacterium]
CSSNGSDKSGVGSAGTSPVLSNDGMGPGAVFNTGDMQSGNGSLLDPTDTCVGEEAGTELAPAVVELLIDTSLSMDENAPGSRRSKWEETRDAMLSAIALMPATTAIGVVFYPNVDVGEMPCFNSSAQVPIAPLGADGSAQRAALSAAFQAQSPNGSTPTHDAYRYALSQLGAATSPGQKYLVLATDGVPTYALDCKGSGTEQAPADPTPLIPEAASALGRGIKTFVIGSPGSENARQSLSQMAQAGGSASAGCSNTGPNYCHFDMTQKPDFASALRDALAQISGLALSCTYDIPPPPNGGTLDLTKVNVLYTAPGGMPELIGQNPTGSCSDGWAYSSDNKQVVLCGDTCNRVKSSSGQVSLQFGCTTQQSIR